MTLKKYKFLTIAIFMIAIVCHKLPAQTDQNFERGRKLAPHLSFVYYRATQTTGDASAFQFRNFPSTSFRIGGDYLFTPEKLRTFKTGLYIDMIPFYNFEFRIKEVDLPEDYAALTGIVNSYKEQWKLFFTIPFTYELRKQMGGSHYFGLTGGVEFILSAEGGYDVGVAYSNEQQTESRELFLGNGWTTDFFLHPGVVISPSWYFITEKINYQLSFTYKKNIIPILDGEYQFGNVEVSDPVRGDYRMTGDFIAIGLTTHFKKHSARKEK